MAKLVTRVFFGICLSTLAVSPAASQCYRLFRDPSMYFTNLLNQFATTQINAKRRADFLKNVFYVDYQADIGAIMNARAELVRLINDYKPLHEALKNGMNWLQWTFKKNRANQSFRDKVKIQIGIIANSYEDLLQRHYFEYLALTPSAVQSHVLAVGHLKSKLTENQGYGKRYAPTVMDLARKYCPNLLPRLEKVQSEMKASFSEVIAPWHFQKRPWDETNWQKKFVAPESPKPLTPAEIENNQVVFVVAPHFRVAVAKEKGREARLTVYAIRDQDLPENNDGVAFTGVPTFERQISLKKPQGHLISARIWDQYLIIQTQVLGEKMDPIEREETKIRLNDFQVE